MKKAQKFLFPLLFVVLVFTLYLRGKPQADPNSSYQKVTDGKAVFIDVREEDEVKEGMIKNALWIPLSKISEDKTLFIKQMKDLAKDKELYIYCRSGNRSGTAIGYLKEGGVNAINMGGFGGLAKELPTQPDQIRGVASGHSPLDINDRSSLLYIRSLYTRSSRSSLYCSSPCIP